MIGSITLNPALDKILYVPHFGAGSAVRVERVSALAGGKGVNIAVILNRLGHQTLVSGLLGGFVGESIEDSLAGQGISIAFQHIREDTRANVIIVERGGRSTPILEPGPNVAPAEIDRFLLAYERVINVCDTVVIAGSLPPGTPKDIYEKLISLAKAKGIYTVLNARGEAFTAGVRAGPDLAKPDLRLEKDVLGVSAATPSGRREATERLFEMGVKTVAISLRHHGHAIYSGEEAYELTVEKEPAVSSVIAGEAFLAGLIDALKRKMPLGEAGVWAMATSLAATLRPEKRWAAPEEIEEQLGQIRRKSVW